MTEKTMGFEYLAGFFDGEACFSMGLRESETCRRGQRIDAMITVSNTHKRVLDEIRAFLSLHNIKHGFSKHTLDKRARDPRQAWSISIHSTSLDTLLPLITPYLIVKKEQAETMMKFRALVESHGWLISDSDWNRMLLLTEYCCLLNQYGGH